MRVALEEKHPPRLMLHRKAISVVIEGKKNTITWGKTHKQPVMILFKIMHFYCYIAT